MLLADAAGETYTGNKRVLSLAWGKELGMMQTPVPNMQERGKNSPACMRVVRDARQRLQWSLSTATLTRRGNFMSAHSESRSVSTSEVETVTSPLNPIRPQRETTQRNNGHGSE